MLAVLFDPRDEKYQGVLVNLDAELE